MAETPDLTPNIQTNAQGFAAASVEGNSVSAQRIPDLIEADKYLKAADAVAGTKRRGLIITKLRPPGAS